jgi:hypothetical protein
LADTTAEPSATRSTYSTVTPKDGEWSGTLDGY